MPLITFDLSLSDVRRTRSMDNKALGVRSASSMSNYCLPVQQVDTRGE